MADTKITRLRNLMTPIVNYFALLERLNNEDTPIEEFNKTIKLLHKEDDNAQGAIDEVRKIIAEIPDGACEGKISERANEGCNISDVNNRRELLIDFSKKVLFGEGYNPPLPFEEMVDDYLKGN